MQTLIRGASKWGRTVLDLLLPPTCLTCDSTTDAPGRFCAACFGKMQFITEPFCRRCAIPFTHAAEATAHGICAACSEYPPPWRQARAALRYDAHSRRLILPLKHGDRVELAFALARMMARAGASLLENADLLVPVPLHPSRLRARRYNQRALLAREIAKLTAVPARLDALVRLRSTQPLGDLSAEQRSRMVAHAFAPRRGATNALAGRRILLIDDVMTSGATCTACTLALLASGAAQVDVLTAARVPDPRQDEDRHLAVRQVSADL
jgi:ComF family protein